MLKLTLIRWYGTAERHFLPALNVACESADLADDTLPCQPHHEAGAVVALERGAEGPNQELVRFQSFATRAQHLLLLLLRLL